MFVSESSCQYPDNLAFSFFRKDQSANIGYRNLCSERTRLAACHLFACGGVTINILVINL
jgi:hypothetical protein